MIEFYIPQCNHPQILVSQVALRLLYDGASLQYFGREMNFGHQINDIPCSVFLKKAYKIFRNKPKDLQDAYIIDSAGHKNYLFQLVECGHCEMCLHRKQVDMVNRATLEQQMYDCPPYFVTLTYDNAHLPAYGELRYTDVQRFFKRLRRSWDRRGVKHDVRYICCGEYGHRHGRPHYHLLLFNNPYHCDETMKEHYRLCADIYDAWSEYDPRTGRRTHFCTPAAFRCEPCAGGAPAYVTKYMCKDVRKDKHFFKPFVKTSIKNGGIGMPFIRQHLDFFRANPSINKFSFVDNSDGHTKEILFGKYALRHIFPSVSTLIPIKIREAFRQSVDVVARLVSCGDMAFRDGALLVEQLRPSGYLRNKFSRKLVREVPKFDYSEDSSFYERYIQTLLHVLDELVDILLQPFDVDEYLISQSYQHKLLSLPQIDNFGSLASRYYNLRATQQDIFSRTLF